MRIVSVYPETMLNGSVDCEPEIAFYIGLEIGAGD